MVHVYMICMDATAQKSIDFVDCFAVDILYLSWLTGGWVKHPQIQVV